MPSVFTIQGHDRESDLSRGTDCKWVTNGRTKCQIQLCYVGKSKKTPSGWQFMRGTSKCPLSGGKRAKRKRRRKR